MLGELYSPKGLAFETAKAILEVDSPLACNVALGCSNGCTYCYGPLSARKKREDWLDVRLPKESPAVLVERQVDKLQPSGVFLSFFTDPFLECNRENTEELIEVLLKHSHAEIATLSKCGISLNHGSVKNGVSLVSLDERFWKTFEPNALSPRERLRALCWGHNAFSSWVSMEPYPCSAIWRQDIYGFLEELAFWGVDFIVFGKWNYDQRASTPEARNEYRGYIEVLMDFCKSNGIRLHVKSETLDFINGGESKR